MIKTILIFLTFFSIGSVQAQDFEVADELFALRGEGHSRIMEAVTAYERLISQGLSQEDLIYATEQIATLFTYRAQLIPARRIKERKPFLDRCLKAAERINPRALQGEETVAYFYWKGSCLALWAEANGIISSLRLTKDIIGTCRKGRTLNPRYFGGGFDRVLGEMYARLPAVNPFGPSGDIRKAKSYFKSAMKMPAYEEAINPEYDTGEYYFETHYLYAKALLKNGETQAARSFIKKTLTKIKSGDFHPDREPEARLAQGLLEAL